MSYNIIYDSKQSQRKQHKRYGDDDEDTKSDKQTKSVSKKRSSNMSCFKSYICCCFCCHNCRRMVGYTIGRIVCVLISCLILNVMFYITTRSNMFDDDWMINVETDFITWFTKKYGTQAIS